MYFESVTLQGWCNQNDQPKNFLFQILQSSDHSSVDTGGLFNSVLTTEHSLIQQLDEKSQLKPLLIFHDDSDVVDASDVIIDIAHKEGFPCPRYKHNTFPKLLLFFTRSFKKRRWTLASNLRRIWFIFYLPEGEVLFWKKRIIFQNDVMIKLILTNQNFRYVSLSQGNEKDESDHLSRINELNSLISNCKKERRWLIVDNFHAIYRSDNKLALPNVTPSFRIFLLTNHFKMKRFRWWYLIVNSTFLVLDTWIQIYPKLSKYGCGFTLPP